jgi:hypothetical protein
MQRRRARDERGAVLVEAAFILPIMMMITFGAIEYGLATSNSAAIKQSTRSGVRMVSTSPKVDAYALAADAVRTTLESTEFITPIEMWIYRARPTDGRPFGGDGTFNPSGCPVATCQRYTWNTSTSSWTLVSGSWTPTAQYACLLPAAADPNLRYPDAVGVWVKAEHGFVTGFFGDDITLTERTTMRLEPVPSTAGCARS